YFFLDPADYDSDALSKYWDDKTCEFLKVLKQTLEELQKFDSGSIEGALRKTAERLGIKAAQLIHPFRIALTGLGVSPDIFEIASLLKKEAVLRRLDNIINFYS
ncbi:MAG: glutamate--tRNA ligase, partial [Candidatus Neomarinimicrobiota bacterium]